MTLAEPGIPGVRGLHGSPSQTSCLHRVWAAARPAVPSFSTTEEGLSSPFPLSQLPSAPLYPLMFPFPLPSFSSVPTPPQPSPCPSHLQESLGVSLNSLAKDPSHHSGNSYSQNVTWEKWGGEEDSFLKGAKCSYRKQARRWGSNRTSQV